MPFESVRVSLYTYADDTIGLFYVGLPDDLVAAGCCTPDMLAPGGKGRRRCDADGHQFRRRSWGSGGRLEVSRYLPLETALAMPGVAALLSELRRRPPDRMLTALEAQLRDRYPGLQIRAHGVVTCSGDKLQSLAFDGPVCLLERYKLATRAWLVTAGARRRYWEFRGEHGNRCSGGIDYQDATRGYLRVRTVIESDTPEHLPQWAEQGARRMLRKLARR